MLVRHVAAWTLFLSIEWQQVAPVSGSAPQLTQCSCGTAVTLCGGVCTQTLFSVPTVWFQAVWRDVWEHKSDHSCKIWADVYHIQNNLVSYAVPKMGQKEMMDSWEISWASAMNRSAKYFWLFSVGDHQMCHITFFLFKEITQNASYLKVDHKKIQELSFYRFLKMWKQTVSLHFFR